MTSAARLIARYGTQPSQEYILTQPVTTIGREPINDIPLNDAEVSRRHARISLVAGVYHIEDLGSTNGTFVNGYRVVSKTALKHDDIIDFAETQRFRFVGAGVEDTPPMNFEADYPATVMDDQPAAYPPPAAQPAPAYPPTQIDFPQGASDYPATQIDAQPVPVPLPPQGAAPAAVDWGTEAEDGGRSRTPLIIGCFLTLILVVIVLSVIIVILDGYNNGELLYCGPLRPLFEAIATGTGQVLACP